jgi:hypothetical protein
MTWVADGACHGRLNHASGSAARRGHARQCGGAIRRIDVDDHERQIIEMMQQLVADLGGDSYRKPSRLYWRRVISVQAIVLSFESMQSERITIG